MGPCNAHEPLDYQKKCFDLCGMFFKTASRINPQTGNLSIYYRLVIVNEKGRIAKSEKEKIDNAAKKL